MTRRILEQQGYKVTSENEPQKSLQAVMKTPGAFDLVLTDITMPGITGDRLASHILAVRPDMPVVLMTGFSRLISDDTYRERGIKEIMIKPLSRATLVKQVRKILDEKGGRRRGH
jgi:DNA-binding NtrC family response regulator